MKSYTITVNGVAYDVTVEEGAGNAVAASAPKAAPKAAPAKAAAPASAGSVTVAASAAGKIVKIEASYENENSGCCSTGRNHCKY